MPVLPEKFRIFFSPSPLPTNKQMSPSPQIKAHCYASCYLRTRIKPHFVCMCAIILWNLLLHHSHLISVNLSEIVLSFFSPNPWLKFLMPVSGLCQSKVHL